MRTSLFLCLAATTVFAQEQAPHIGYVYPAGGQQGTTFQAQVGGQYLDGVNVAHITGSGGKAKIMDHLRPLNQGAFKFVQKQMQDLQAQKKENASAWTAENEKRIADLRAKMTSFYIRQSSVPSLVETVTLEVTIAPNAVPGQRELRLQTAEGLTNPLVFEIGQLPEWSEPSGRSSAVAESQSGARRRRPPQNVAKPMPGSIPVKELSNGETTIALPSTLNGQILPGDVDRYRFQARKGAQLVAVVSARRLIPYLSDAVPGWFQAAVTLFDAEGKELAYDDDFRFHPDPVLHCAIPQDGEYVLEIRDALHRGREDFVYRVAIGELPYVTGTFPLGGRAGTESTLELSGWNLPVTKLTGTAQAPGVRSVFVRQGTFVSNRVPFAVDTLPECMETEPDNQAAGAQRVNLPVIVNGRIDPPGDLDVFCFAGRAGQQIAAEVKARRLDSALDSALKLTTASGEQVAFNDDYEDKAAGLTTHHADSRLSATLPADGLYYLFLVDEQQHGGADHGYRLHLAAPQPDFELRVVPSALNARAGSTIPVTVHVLRRDGFDGEIALALRDAPPGFTLSGARVPAGQDRIRMTLTVPEEPAAAAHRLCLLGRATVLGRQVIHQAVPADDLMQAFVYRHLVPALDWQVCVAAPTQGFTAGTHGVSSIRIPLGGEVRVPLTIQTNAVPGEIEVSLNDPPPGITIEGVALGSTEGVMVFRCDAEAVEPGQKGNLVVDVFAVRDLATMKGREQRKKPRRFLTALPAIPFEVLRR